MFVSLVAELLGCHETAVCQRTGNVVGFNLQLLGPFAERDCLPVGSDNEPFQRCLSRVSTALVMTLMRWGLIRICGRPART